MVLDRPTIHVGKSRFHLWYTHVIWLLKLAFLFLDMFSLSIMYCILFCYIRIQSRKLANMTTASTSQHKDTHELQSWEVNIETGEPAQYTTSSQLFTMNSGNTTMEDSHTQRTQTRSTRPRADKRMNQVSLTLLCYPIVYIILTMPIAVSRLCEFGGKKGSLTSIYIGGYLFMSSGLINVLLYTTTRRGIISWRWFLRKFKHEPPSRAAPTHVSRYYPGSSLSQFASSTIHTPQAVASKPSVRSLNTLADGPAKLNVEHDSVSSVDVQKQDYTTLDRISMTKHLW